MTKPLKPPQTIPEHIWRLAEHSLARRERLRLVRLGHITPVFASRPQMMVKDDQGRWCPEIKVVT